jgi:hypothetical protein
MHPRARATDTTPFEGASEDEVESADLLPKDRCSCQRSRPSRPAYHDGHDTGPTRDSPAPLRSERAPARRHGIWDLQPNGPSLPKARDGAWRRHQPGRKEQPLRCGRRDLAPRGASFKASSEFPRREPPRGRYRRWCLSALTSRPGDPGLGGEKHPFQGRHEVVPLGPGFKHRHRVSSTTGRLSTSTRNGAAQPRFKAWRSKPQRQEHPCGEA